MDSLQDYNQVFRAVAFFSFKYGKIDWIESLNEFWLEQDARLRTDFNVTTGIRADRISFIKEKSLMKKLYLDAGIPTARQHVVSTREAGRAFIELVGYPVIVSRTSASVRSTPGSSRTTRTSTGSTTICRSTCM